MELEAGSTAEVERHPGLPPLRRGVQSIKDPFCY